MSLVNLFYRSYRFHECFPSHLRDVILDSSNPERDVPARLTYGLPRGSLRTQTHLWSSLLSNRKVKFDFCFSVFRTASFRVERSEDRKHVCVRRLPYSRDKTKKDCEGDYLTVNWRMLKNTHGVSDPLEDNSLCWRTPISSIKQTIEEIENGIKLFYFELKLHTSVTMDSPARNIKQQVISEKSSLRWPRRSLCANLSTMLVIALSTSTNWKKEQMWILVVGLVIRKMVKFNQGLNQILSLAVLSKNM